MRLATYCLSFFIIALSFTSCQREPDVELGTDPPPITDPGTGPDPADDSTYLKMLVYLDTSLASGSDSIEKEVFNYDASKRLSTWEHVIFGFSSSPTIHDMHTRIYEGVDTLPSKVVNTTNYASSASDRDSSFLTYSNSMIVKDSIREYLHGVFVTTRVIEYRQMGNGLWDIYINGVLIYGSRQTRVAGNMVFEFDTTYHDTRSWGAVRTYDNHPSRDEQMLLPFPAQAPIIGLVDTHWGSVRNLNNITHTEETVDGSAFDSYGLIYEYRRNGYPSVVRYSDAGDTEKGIYIYTKL